MSARRSGRWLRDRAATSGRSPMTEIGQESSPASGLLRVCLAAAFLVVVMATMEAAFHTEPAAAIQFYGTPEPTPHETLKITDPFPTSVPQVVVTNLPSGEELSPMLWL